MTQLLKESLALVSQPENLDKSVDEVFSTMLGVHCESGEYPIGHEPELVTAVVGFGGAMSGACVLRMGQTIAIRMASKMTGMNIAELDDTVTDAAGEICNMLAGTWKGHVPEVSVGCMLSVPTVVTGRDYQIHVQKPEFRIGRAYHFEGHLFEVMIVCDGVQ
jgi:chemotaxis protein CheX